VVFFQNTSITIQEFHAQFDFDVEVAGVTRLEKMPPSKCQPAFCFRFRTRSTFQLCSVYIKCAPVCSVYRIYIRLICRGIDFVKVVCSILPSERFKKLFFTSWKKRRRYRENVPFFKFSISALKP